MTALFGYGSLILPTSLVSRFEDLPTDIGAVYDGTTTDRIRPSAMDAWRRLEDRITYLPAKLYGFRRYYSLESPRGGTMLEIVPADDDEWINGVAICGLSDPERDAVADTEDGYERRVFESLPLEWYVDPETAGVDAPSTLEVFVSHRRPDDIETARRRNETYHERILLGIELLGETYGADVAEAFYRDFCATTYETAVDADDPTVFNTVAENDRKLGESPWRTRQ